jgi:hypothetical protein
MSRAKDFALTLQNGQPSSMQIESHFVSARASANPTKMAEEQAYMKTPAAFFLRRAE